EVWVILGRSIWQGGVGRFAKHLPRQGVAVGTLTPICPLTRLRRCHWPSPGRQVMARKNEAPRSATHHSAPRSSASLKNLRAQTDKLDFQIVELVNKRASVAGEIGKHKNDQGEDVFSPAREEEVLANVVKANAKVGGPLDETCIRAIFREVMS